jgi:hypothetical protein
LGPRELLAPLQELLAREVTGRGEVGELGTTGFGEKLERAARVV